MIQINKTFAIPEEEFEEKFIHSSGPGGQNVNKVATAVQLRFNVDQSSSLPEDVKDRLRQLARNQITSGGNLMIEAREHRTQEKNRQAARDKLAHLIRQALNPPRQRKRTRPSRASREKRLESKRITAKKKHLRQDPPPSE